MITNLVFAAIAGYCGTDRIRELLRRLRELLRNGGGPTPIEPGDWPPNCPQCGKFAAIGAGVLSYFALSALYPNEVSIGNIMIVGFFAGRVGDEIGNAVGGMMRK